MLGRVVFGSRTWTCTIAAPALAASIADCAICAGVTGTAGLRPGVSADPVTAHEIMTLRCISSPRLPVGVPVVAAKLYASRARKPSPMTAYGVGVGDRAQEREELVSRFRRSYPFAARAHTN